MPTLLGADLIVQTLAREGIDAVFTLPGGQMNPVHFAVQEEPGLDLISPRQEGAGALMAAGYALAAGKPGCVMTTVGAGIAYEIGALYFAWKERLPLLSISPQVQSYKMKPIQENLQACDQDEIFRPLTKFTAICYHRDRIPDLVRRALKTALTPEYGPVHLDVPVDVIYGFQRVSAKKRRQLFPAGGSRFTGQIFPNRDRLDAAAKILAEARKPLILAGRNLERARVGEQLATLLEANQFPVITSTAAYASADNKYTNNLGSCPLWAEETARHHLSATDCLCLLEADEETARLARQLKAANPALPVIQTAEVAACLGSIVPLAEGLLGSPAAVLEELGQALQSHHARATVDTTWTDTLLAAKADTIRHLPERIAGSPDRFHGVVHTLDAINRILRPEDMVICEGPTAAFAALAHLQHPGRHSTIILADDDVPGAGFPLALGARLARPAARVFFLSETALFKRHHRELQTQHRYGLGTTGFVFQSHKRKPEEEVNFAVLARSLGVSAQAITDPEEEVTDTLLTDALSAPSGIILDISG